MTKTTLKIKINLDKVIEVTYTNVNKTYNIQSNR